MVPDIGDAEKIELIGWSMDAGAHVSVGDELCELVTDKASFPLEAPCSGTLLSIEKEAGQSVHVGEVLAHLKPD